MLAKKLDKTIFGLNRGGLLISKVFSLVPKYALLVQVIKLKTVPSVLKTEKLPSLEAVFRRNKMIGIKSLMLLVNMYTQDSSHQIQPLVFRKLAQFVPLEINMKWEHLSQMCVLLLRSILIVM